MVKKSFHLDALKGIVKRNLHNKQLLTYATCLCVAIVFWYINELDKSYTQVVNVPVKYIGYPEDKLVLQLPVSTLQVEMQANGFVLLKHVVGLNFTPLMLNVEALDPQRASRRGTDYFVKTQSLGELLLNYFGNDAVIRDITPDTLWFGLDDMLTRDIPVKPNLQISVDKQCLLHEAEVECTPRTVTVSGPRSVMDTLQYVYTEPIRKKKLKDTLSVSVVLNDYSQLRIKHRKVEVVVPVENYTEADLNVTLTLKNVPSDVVLKTFPASVHVTCNVGVSEYNKLDPSLFRVEVDYESLLNTSDASDKARVSLSAFPDYVSNVKINPQYVDFLIER